TLAMVQGCFGPAFFAFCVATAVATGRFWNCPLLAENRRPGRLLFGLSLSLVALAYLQLVLGAMLRHVQPTASVASFTMTVAIHVMTAFLLWALVGISWWQFSRTQDGTLSRPAGWLIPLVGLQILLGVGTWVVNYGYPRILAFVPGSGGFVVQAKGYIDSMIVTSHVATGSLILAVATMLAVRCARRYHLHGRQTKKHEMDLSLPAAGRNAASGSRLRDFELQHASS
ncbi:MAG: hypothetical protein AAF664_11400, partial [Planctomycetota bacterium]